MLTQTQKAIIAVGVACLILLACYVPWTYTFNGSEGIHREKPAGYHFIFQPPQPEHNFIAHGVKVDVLRVVIPMVVVLFATIAAVVLASSKHPARDPRQGQGHDANQPYRHDTGSGENKSAFVGPREPSPEAEHGEIKRTEPVPQSSKMGVVPEPSGSSTRGDSPDSGPQGSVRRFTWVIFTAGVFLFFAGYSPILFADPGFFVCGGITWVVLFGLPAFLFYRFKMFLGVAVVATLFFLATALHVGYSIYDFFVIQPRIEALRSDMDTQVRFGKQASGQNSANGTDNSSITDRILAAGKADHQSATNGRDNGSGPEKKQNSLNTASTDPAADNPFFATLGEEAPPKDVSGYFKRALTRANKGDYDNAIRDYDAAIRLDPKNAEYRFLCGHAWFKKERYEVAIGHYNDAIRLEPNRADWYFSRGLAWSELKAYAKAQKDFDEAQRLDPKNGK